MLSDITTINHTWVRNKNWISTTRLHVEIFSYLGFS
jgi:hypothetical protein